MNYKRLLLIVLLIFLVLLIFSCTKNETPTIKIPEGKTAKIIFLVGDVFIQKDSNNWDRAEIGDILKEGEFLKTGENSYCEIIISSGTIFRMKDRSKLKLTLLPKDAENNKSIIKLFTGSLFAKVDKITYKSNVTIETESVTLGVRGTKFFVHTENYIQASRTQLFVSDGKVNVKLNIHVPSKNEIPKELKTVFKSINRGINVREGYKIDVSTEKTDSLSESIRKYLRLKSITDQELSKLKQDIKVNPLPLNEKDKKKLEELESVSLIFKEGMKYYISPNFDGINDEFVFNTEDYKNERIYGWELIFFDGKANKVKSIKNRIPEDNDPLSLPDTILWNMVNEKGNIVNDGNYIYEFYTHNKTRKKRLRTKGVINVDTVPPFLNLNAEDITFSPNDDGVKDTLKIMIEASEGIDWTCSITTQEEIIVKTLEWGKDIPKIFEWDGRGENGNILPEGVYNITISGIDKAGNRTIKTVKDITIDVRARRASVDIDNAIFSPNGDGILDTVTFKPVLSDRYRIDTWDLVVQTVKGDTAKRFRGRRYLPPSIEWDGKPQNATELLPSDTYIYFLKVIYRSGVNTYTFKKKLVLDNDPPEITVEISPNIFSPDGDGVDDTLFIKPKIEDLTPIINWKATVFDANGNTFKTFSGENIPKEEIGWNGISDTGQLVDSGEDYYFIMEAQDSGYNKGISNKIPFSIDILVISTERGLKIRVSNIEFDFNKETLRGEKTYEILEKIVNVLKKYGKYSVLIEGHTDSTGDEDYNLILSKNRAEAVGEYLIKNGIAEKRLSYQGYGSKHPIDTNETKEGRARNRRVEFILIRK